MRWTRPKTTPYGGFEIYRSSSPSGSFNVLTTISNVNDTDIMDVAVPTPYINEYYRVNMVCDSDYTEHIESIIFY